MTTALAVLGLGASIFEWFQRPAPSSRAAGLLATPVRVNTRAALLTATLIAVGTPDVAPVGIVAGHSTATQLPFHGGKITSDMTHYQGLNEIIPKSPAAILELGFLGSDHDLLKNHRELLAQGVAPGIRDFLHGDECQSRKPFALNYWLG